MKDVEISLNSTHIKPNEQILGIHKAYFDNLEYGMCNGKTYDETSHTVTPDHRYTDSYSGDFIPLEW